MTEPGGDPVTDPDGDRVDHGRSLGVARLLAPGRVTVDAIERPITVDQTNASVVVGEAVVVKWLRPPVAHPSETVMLLGHLAEAGFTEMPHFDGALVEGDPPMVLAMVSSFVPGALDGWDWYVDELTAALDAGTFAAPLASAGAIGALAARLHDALATPTSLVPEPTSRRSPRDEQARGIDLLEEALACTHGPEGSRLVARAPRIRRMIDSLGRLDDVDVQHVHGDLHVGQLLRNDTVLVVNDFDGNPVAATADRHRMRTTMADLASLLQSVDHVGRIVARRRPADADAIEHFIAEAVERVESEYGSIRPSRPGDEVLLAALRTIQELHELVYAARSLPRWLYVPDLALTAMFPEDDG